MHSFANVGVQQHRFELQRCPPEHFGSTVQLQFPHVSEVKEAHVCMQNPEAVKLQNGCTQHSLPLGEHVPFRAPHHALSHTQPLAVMENAALSTALP